MKKQLLFSLLFSLLIVSGFENKSNAQTIVYSQYFISGGTPTTQCTAWETFRASLLSTYAYTSFTISGSADPTGITCSSPTITLAVANAMRTGTSYASTFGGYTWTVNAGCTTGSGCTSTPVELGVIGSCACSTGYDLRPNIGNNNWGGINGVTCGAASQTMIVTFNYTPPSACSGSVTAGTATGPSTACGSTSFSLGLTGSTFASGITYQWQSSTSSTGPWTNITGGTTLSFTTTETATTYYRCYIVCTSASTSDTSSTHLVTYTPCYCTPSWLYASAACTSYGMYINPFTLTGYTGAINDVGACTGTGYEDNSSTMSCTLQQGTSYTANIGTGTSYTLNCQAWIDFNNDGTFQTSESVGGVNGIIGGTNALGITIPTGAAGAATGSHRMRVVAIYNGYGTTYPSISPCPSGSYPYYYGDARDYTVNIVPICPFTLSATNNGPVCPGGSVTITGTTTASGWSWSGPGSFTSTLLSTTITGISTGGTYTFTATNGSCSTSVTTTVAMTTAPATPVITPAHDTICNGGSVMLYVPSSGTNLLPVQSWESGVPGTWSILTGGVGTAWFQIVGTSTSLPATGGTPTGGGTYVAEFNSFSIGSGGHSTLCSPSFSTAGTYGNTVTFWMYRDPGYAGYTLEGVTIYQNSTPSLTGATSLGYVPRWNGTGITGGVTGVSMPTTAGWYQYTCTITGSSSTNYLMFYAYSQFGNNTYIDLISTTGTPSVPTWSPTTYLFSNSGLSTAYTTGTAMDTVYVHPTTVTTPTVITYYATVTNGTCSSTDSSVITINPAVTSISGPTQVCVGATITVSDGTSGGTWSSSAPGIASVGSTSGVVTGNATGTATILYTIGGCSASVTITVQPSPAAISGVAAVCQGGGTSLLSDATTGGTWSSSNTTFATVGSSTGFVTAYLAGTPTISYTSSSTGCSATIPFTVNPTPAAISGTPMICFGLTTTLLDASGTGTWTSFNPGVASINPSTGVATGVSLGTTTITFTLPTTCFTTLIVTVNPLPTAILGRDTVCEGSTVLLSDMTGGGTWSSGLSGTASIGSSTGLVTGVSSGSAPVTYTVNASGCIATANVWVNPLPALISGQNYACAAGSSTSLSDATGGGTWSSSDTSVAVVSTSGLVTSSTSGVTIITYSLPTGCLRTDVVTINPLPSNIYGPDSVCFGYTTVVMDSTSGGYFTSSAPGIATVDSFTGAVHGLGVGTTMISYTASGTGCTNPRAFTVNPILTVGLSIASLSGTTVCADDIVTFITNPVNGGTSPVYQWKVNGVNSGSGTTFTLNPHNLDSVSCVMTSNGVCAIPSTTSAYLIMTVNPLVNPILNMSTSYPDDTLCIGKRDSFWVSSTYGGTSPVYQWSVNWVSVLTGSTSFAYTPANGDIVTCKMTSSSPCPRPDTVDATAVLVVQDYHIPTVAITSSDGTDICQGNRVNIVPTSTWGGWTPAFHWSLNGSNLGILPGYSYYPSNGDTIECTMISNYRCTMPNDTAVVKMGFVVEPVIQVHISGRSLIMYGQSDTLHANVINGGSSPTYQWGINGSPVGGATGSTFITPYLTNFDSVYCIVTTHGGACDGVAAFNWIIMEVGRTSISQVNSSINELQLIPNPNKGMFTVKGMISGDVETVEMTICDVVGQVVYKGNAEVKAGKLDKDIQLGTNLADGMYLLNMKTGTEKQVIRFSVNR